MDSFLLWSWGTSDERLPHGPRSAVVALGTHRRGDGATYGVESPAENRARTRGAGADYPHQCDRRLQFGSRARDAIETRDGDQVAESLSRAAARWPARCPAARGAAHDHRWRRGTRDSQNVGRTPADRRGHALEHPRDGA